MCECSRIFLSSANKQYQFWSTISGFFHPWCPRGIVELRNKRRNRSSNALARRRQKCKLGIVRYSRVSDHFLDHSVVTSDSLKRIIMASPMIARSNLNCTNISSFKLLTARDGHHNTSIDDLGSGCELQLHLSLDDVPPYPD